MAKKVVPISSKPRGPALSLVVATEEKTTQPPQPHASAAEETREETAGNGLIARAVYGSVYCLSFGVVFGALVLGKLVPGRRLIAKGLQDGTAAACNSLNWFGTEQDAHAAGISGEGALKA
ncbi:MAG: hypothetical protein PHT19_06505 [Methylococcus sp.]|nr:hypothetical protein [Methylococcus sp.]